MTQHAYDERAPNSGLETIGKIWNLRIIMSIQKEKTKKMNSADIVERLREVAWQDEAHLDDVYDNAADKIEELEQALALAISKQEGRPVLGYVEDRPVFKGDKLYVDIRGTCAREWGPAQVAAQGANEGQGAMIVFEGGDYRMNKDLVWEPRREQNLN
jgi:hypothetical protein